MAIDKIELTEEQKAALVKLYKRYMLKLAGAVALYFGFLVFANLAIAIICQLKHIDGPAQLFLAFGTGFICMLGLQGTAKEMREVTAAKAKEITGK